MPKNLLSFGDDTLVVKPAAITFGLVLSEVFLGKCLEIDGAGVFTGWMPMPTPSQRY